MNELNTDDLWTLIAALESHIDTEQENRGFAAEQTQHTYDQEIARAKALRDRFKEERRARMASFVPPGV